MSSLFPETHPGLDWKTIQKRAEEEGTPLLILNPEVVVKRYRELRESFAEARVFYAIKANPARTVVQALAEAGSGFDLASPGELDIVKEFRVSPDKILYGNTIKRLVDIQKFYDYGVRIFASDSEDDLLKIARGAPGSSVYIRLLAGGPSKADWPLDRKFGCTDEMAASLLRRAQDLGLSPGGISFHTGSQQNGTDAWKSYLERASRVFSDLAVDGIFPRYLNLGGGFPVPYLKSVPDLRSFVENIRADLREQFPVVPEVLIEPGRYLSAEAGVLVTEIMLVSRKNPADPHRWVYLDAGPFSGAHRIRWRSDPVSHPLRKGRGRG